MKRGSVQETELIHQLDNTSEIEKQRLYKAQCTYIQLSQCTEPFISVDSTCISCRQSHKECIPHIFDMKPTHVMSNTSKQFNNSSSKSYKWFKQRLKKDQIQISKSLYNNSKGHLPPKECEPPFRRRKIRNLLYSSRLLIQRTKPPQLIFLLLHLIFLNILYIPFCLGGEFTEEQLLHFRKERTEAAEKWAPLVFLHPDERYFPSDVHSFLQNVIPREIPESERTSEPPVVVSLSRSLDIYSLPEGIESEDTYLIAPLDENCKNCPLPNFLHGTKPSSDYSPPMYAVITSCLPTKTEYVRSPRNTQTPKSQSRRRKFRLKRRRRKLSFKDRLKLFRRRRTSLPSDWETYTDIEPLNSFTSEEEYDTLEEGESSKDYSLKDREEDFVDTVVKPPSTTLIPPRRRLATVQNQSENDDVIDDVTEDANDVVTTITSDYDSLVTEIIQDINSTNANSSEASYFIISPDKESNSNFTNNNITTFDLDATASLVTKEDKKKSGSSHKEHESQENDIPEGNIQINNSHRFTVTYWMFYPYSQGKQVCTSRLWILGRVFKPRLRNKCYGDLITLNSHVGDWEHVSIYFEDDLPQRMYVSTHTYGAYYNYEPNENIFVYRGKDTRLGLPLNPKYPPIIKMDGTHPVLYAALGSHGLWGNPGVHRYENLVPLEDKTSAGTPWKSWRNVDIIDYRDPEHLRPDRQWLKFYGRWGNPSSGCHRALFGTCDLASGPTGIPLKRENFPCHLPDHPTFFPEI